MSYHTDKDAKRVQREPHRTSSSRRIRRSGADWFGLIAMGLLMVCSVMIEVTLLTLQMLPTKYVLLLMVALLVINAVNVIVQIPVSRKKSGKVICGVISVLLSAVMIYGFVASCSVQSTIAKITKKTQEVSTIDVIVLQTSSAQSLPDVKGEQFGFFSGTDDTKLGEIKSYLSKKIGEVQMTGADSVTHLADSLYNGSVRVILMDDAFLNSLSEISGYESFASDTRIIDQFDVVTASEINDNGGSLDITKSPFIVYLSGSDSRSSDISATSRSDVNILAVVNPQSKQILLLNTPRDYYVPLTVSNGMRDKLTHAGVYGIDCSMGTLAALYGIEVPYYVRINFTGFENIVNALGGVTVHSDYTFTSEGYQFVEGDNTLDGAAALTFVRERYSFAGGDNQRGKDQMAMIKAILDKAMSPAILSNYQSLLKAVSGSFLTNFSYDDITSFVQKQLSDGSGWKISSYAVSGTGDMNVTYTYPDEYLYVMWPDDGKVQNAKTLIQQVLDGQTPQTDSVS